MRPIWCVPALLAAALGCQATPAPDTTAEAKQAIDAANAQWPRLTAAGHADSIAEFYQARAVILPPNMPPMHDREAIRSFFAVLNGMSSPPPVLTLRAESVWASGPMAVELGRWHFAWPAGAKRPPGAPAADSGKYIVRWVKDNGRWLMAQDIWNSDIALPQPQPPARAARSGYDGLGRRIREAHRRGLRVHAWLNTELVANADTLPQDSTHFVFRRPDLLAVPRPLARELYDADPRDPHYVQALAEYARANRDHVEGLYTSPAAPEVKEHIYSVWIDLVERYDLDGLHFDYVRYPAPDYDYSRVALERFRDWLDAR